MKNFFKHWQSTVAGAAIAVLNMILQGNTDPKTLGVSAGIMILGAIVKDPNDKSEK